jgi:hypothetical protein
MTSKKTTTTQTTSATGIGLDPKTGFPFTVGDKILIRTVTMYQLGRVVGVGADTITLAEASWVADVGRLGEALAKGSSVLLEVEKAPSWICVGRGAIVDVFPWSHDLPTDTK